jgi:hypothetical protein
MTESRGFRPGPQPWGSNPSARSRGMSSEEPRTERTREVSGEFTRAAGSASSAGKLRCSSALGCLTRARLFEMKRNAPIFRNLDHADDFELLVHAQNNVPQDRGRRGG